MMDENKTLEELENDFWPQPDHFPTGLVETCYALRKKRLGDFEPKDVRVMLGQQMGLEFLVPKAIGFLRGNILEEAWFYPGDLLDVLLRISASYWDSHPVEKSAVLALLEASKDEIDASEEINRETRREIEKFVRGM